ncbi:uncharacterized protein LOC127002785 isoform X2 [Eriocheir sinensis]|uniref:uncharacterized protein LOC127002785 isoform X2 n=1 Tax=Eriocheir sinensis TaxID=95602 RepID=UPI0021C613BC|nr:uncharacterized protein LOC127002785 isoform X2 [Eriocheir sinensis]
MVGRRGRPPKRKVEELQEDLDMKPKSSKEARIEAIPLDASEPVPLALMTLGPDVWTHHEASEEWSDDLITPISKAEEGGESMLSQGMCWKGIPYPPLSQVVLSCNRVPNGEAFDCETQTLHFSRVSSSTVVMVPDPNTTETIKMEIDTDHPERNVALGSEEAFMNLPLVCCVEGCGARSDTDTTSTFYIVPVGQDRPLWAETLNIVPGVAADVKQHVCSKHFIVPTKVLFAPKSKTRKKKTCDMLVAEEAEIIKQGLASGRPKRTPKPNKNYNWAEIVPLIKAEPDELDEDEAIYLQATSAVSKAGGSVFRAKEDKENKRPTSDMEGEPENEEVEEEEEEDLENISMPSNPRPPPPKPKGRPHRIRDSGTQTEGDGKAPIARLPLREVKVQCSIASQPPSPCTSCSYLNWLRLEELLADCADQVEGDLCASPVQECLRKVVDSVPYPTHATNVLKLLIGEKRDALENTSDIVLVPSQEDDVEIENVIHPEVEEPITGLREITPRTWQKKTKWKKPSTEVEPGRKEEEEVDLDGLGIQEATEMDDEEFHPGYLEEEESEEEDDQGIDDEDWTINKPDRDSKPSVKKKPKKSPQHTKVKKEQMVSAGEGAGEGEGSSTKDDDDSASPGMQDPSGRRRRKEGDTRWIRKAHSCTDCGLMFSTQKKFDQHFNHMHLGIAPWHGEHKCDDCGKVFTQKISLNVHRMFKHGAPRRYQCSQCVYEAPTKEYLKRHMKVHTNERRYVCPHCHKGLKTAESYRNHLVIHTNKGRFVCQVCQKAYNHKGAYQDHIRTHCEYRDYACDYCGAAFKAYKHVARHIRAVHLNDKRFICDVCGAQHMTGFNLKSHVKKHGDLSSLPYAYQCSICEAKFRGPEGRAVHMKVVHTSPSSPASPKTSGGSVSVPKGDDGGRLVSPHPTRRPVQFHYTKIARDESAVAGTVGREGESFGTIYLDNTDDFYPYDGKEDEAVVYEVYSAGEEEELEEQYDKMETEKAYTQGKEQEGQASSGRDRVIHVYPCSLCHIMFTSRSALEQHYETCQERHAEIKEEPESAE